jgi:CubicO group peptidase (beta-lactamase class C family)
VFHPDDFRGLDRYIERRRKAVRNPALSVALVDENGLAYMRGYGRMRGPGSGVVGPNTLFQIGSVSKTFAAVVALQAAEAGLLDLHAPVQRYLPWFEVRSPYQAPITAHHLLSHSAGLPYSVDLGPDPRSVVWALRNIDVGFPPGAHYAYSEPGYQTLTLVLEQVYGRPYATIVQEGILGPLEMYNSSAAITHALRPHVPQGYRTLYDDRPPHSSHPLVPAGWVELNSADGAIASTAGDMGQFAAMLLRRGRGPYRRLLSEQSYRRMTTEVVPGSGYGYGISIRELDGHRRLAHGGDMPGYEAYMAMDLDRGLGVVVLAAQPYPAGLWGQVYDYWRAFGSGQGAPSLATPPDPARVEGAADYAGTFRSEARVLQVVAEGEGLYVELDGERASLERRGTDSFYTTHSRLDRYLLRFEREMRNEDASGLVVALACGPEWYAHDRYTGQRTFHYPREWDAYVGHYRAHNPWLSNYRVFVRKGSLWFGWPWGDEDPLVAREDGTFHLGAEPHSPERMRFEQVVDGQTLRATLSGCAYYRFFTP